MKRKALDKLESIAKSRPGVGTSASLMTDVVKPPPKTLKDLPNELLFKIAKYGIPSAQQYRANKLFESVFRRKPVTDIADLPIELIKKIAEYDVPYYFSDRRFNPRTDIGPLAPWDIDEGIIPNMFRLAKNYYQDYLTDNDSILRKSEQGPNTVAQEDLEIKLKYDIESGKVAREGKLMAAIFGNRMNPNSYIYNMPESYRDELHRLDTEKRKKRSDLYRTKKYR